MWVILGQMCDVTCLYWSNTLEVVSGSPPGCGRHWFMSLIELNIFFMLTRNKDEYWNSIKLVENDSSRHLCLTKLISQIDSANREGFPQGSPGKMKAQVIFLQSYKLLSVPMIIHLLFWLVRYIHCICEYLVWVACAVPTGPGGGLWNVLTLGPHCYIAC